MKKEKLNISLWTILLFFLTINSFCQKKTYLDFMNEHEPTFPSCVNAIDKGKCYKMTIGKIIVKDLNAEENHEKLNEINQIIEIKLRIRSEVSGESTILGIDSKNKNIDEIVLNSLKKLPKVQPVISKENRKVSTFNEFYVIVKKNMKTKLFELIYRNPKVDYSKFPYPNSN